MSRTDGGSGSARYSLERDCWLVIMAREPRQGAVKSRLARDIGGVAATAFYRRILDVLVRRLSFSHRWNTVLAITPDTSISASHWPRGVPLIAQGAGDLGDRMQSIMDEMPPGPVVIVGSDIPKMRPADIGQAFGLLGNHEVVLGPAGDGGYWLVGLKRAPRVPRIFEQVRWSSKHTLTDTLANAAGLKVALARELEDVDDAKNYRKLAAVSARLVPPRAGRA
jgi:rSAM/selenodomain-associated transferase 1